MDSKSRTKALVFFTLLTLFVLTSIHYIITNQIWLELEYDDYISLFGIAAMLSLAFFIEDIIDFINIYIKGEKE